MSNGLIRKLDKTGSTDRTSASGRPRSLRTHEDTTVVFFRLTRRLTGGWENFAGRSGLKKTWWIMWFALKQFFIACVKHFFNRSYDAVIADNILHVCLFAFFASNSLGKISEFIVFIFSEKFCFRLRRVYRMFLLQNVYLCHVWRMMWSWSWLLHVPTVTKRYKRSVNSYIMCD